MSQENDVLDTLEEHTEFETKYRIEPEKLVEFKKIADDIPESKKFIYVEGPDHYYVQEGMEDSFARYRKPTHGLDNGRCEVNFKIKPKDARNNVKRKEFNWRVDKTPEATIHEALKALGWKFNFSIWKSCHIYRLSDATLVFYTVYDTTDGKTQKVDNFVEIEVDEDSISNLTEAQAWVIIEKYEKVLAPLGITPQKRLRKSLFEMYRRNA